MGLLAAPERGSEMKDAEILEMAEQAGFTRGSALNNEIKFIAFTRLIQQAQREEDARKCYELKNVFGYQCAAAIRNSGGAA